MARRDVVFEPQGVTTAERERLLGQRGVVVWITGLPGAGKSTLARTLQRRLHADRRLAFVLDGDTLRHGLCEGLGFSPEDRRENLRRTSEVARLMADAGLVVIVAVISPQAADRADARRRIGAARFREVFLDPPAQVCEARDPKGLWARARRGEVVAFTGVSAPYDRPESPDLRLDTSRGTVDSCAAEVLTVLEEGGFLGAPGPEPGPEPEPEPA